MDPYSGILRRACHRIVVIILGVSIGLAGPLPQATSHPSAMQPGLLNGRPDPGTEFADALPTLGVAGAAFNISWQTACTTPPAGAVTALAYAAGIWGTLISSTVPIEVSACWIATPPCAPGIACGEPTTHLRNLNQAPLVDTFYPAALANALAGADLTTYGPDINLWFDSDVTWSFETSGASGGGADFVSAALHEIAHGLGFAGNMYESYNIGFCGNGPFYWVPCPTTYDRFVVDSQGVPLLNYLRSSPPTLGARLKSDASFGGPNTTAESKTAAKLYTPATWDLGSSLCHLDPATFLSPNLLMLPGLQNGVRHPGPVTLAILQDMGWLLAGDEANLTTSGPKAVGTQSNAGFGAEFIWPGHAVPALEYVWTVTDKSAITHTMGGNADAVTLQWNTPGLKTLAATATGSGASASATRSVLVFSLAASGPAQGDSNQAHTFYATLAPDTTGLPVTYQWQATGQPAVTHPDLGPSDSLAFTWIATGAQTVTVTASIGAASTQAVHTIQIGGTALDHFIYLPLAVRSP